MTRRPLPPTDRADTAPDRTRTALEAFHAAQRPNFFLSDPQLQRLLRTALGPERYARHAPNFAHFGAVAASTLDDAAITNNDVANLPRLERWSAFGDRIEAIANHPSYDVCGRAIYSDGEVIAAYAEPGSNARALGLFFLSSHVGEAGHNCPVACTAGIVKSLQAAGSEDLKRLWLDGLLTANYPERLDGAQFMTEIQGGSDVGQNAVVAEPDPDVPHEFGTTRWRIRGEKWFCSNAEADLILMTARWSDARPGTSGLGLFLVPRIVPENTAGPDANRLNHYHLRRLKVKLGTRSMPSAEIDFDGAIAYAVGPVEDGFKTMMTHVIQTSRVYNSFAVAGNARRARLIAESYARHRTAFGVPIIRLPLVQLMLAECRALGQASLAASMVLARMLDRAETTGLSGPEKAFFRVAANLTKMRTSQHAHRAVMLGIETLGGNGAIESFSILPRLIRDNIVCENWEGTHNTLVAQTVRDFGPIGLAPGFFATLGAMLENARSSFEHESFWPVLDAAWDETKTGVAGLAGLTDPGLAAYRLKPHAERLADLLFALAWLDDVRHEDNAAQRDGELAAISVFADLYLRPVRALPATEVLARVVQLCG
jgi:acyl-CoA dehydrogenase